MADESACSLCDSDLRSAQHPPTVSEIDDGAQEISRLGGGTYLRWDGTPWNAILSHGTSPYPLPRLSDGGDTVGDSKCQRIS